MQILKVMKINKLIFCFLLTCSFLFFYSTLLFSQEVPQQYSTQTITSTPTTSLVEISNEFIKIRCNSEDFDRGRFSVDTTLGDPQSTDDDNQILIYGHPKPWTSYTTVRIDGENFVFGAQTRKRAGKGARFGTEILPPTKKDNEIIETIYSYKDFINVKQQLTFTRSPSTKMKDTALIKYIINNLDDKPHNVGLRIVIDTMIGTNDAAPFRLLDRAIITETQIVGDEIPDFYQAFDSLIDPKVIAQGNLRGGGITPPEKIIFSNWGTLADNLWEFPYEEGRNFMRAGEEEYDTAVALYWYEKILNPNEELIISTSYGLGGITTAAGKLSIGITAPAEISPSKKRGFLIVAYIENTGGFDAKDVKLQLILPNGINLFDESPIREFVEIKAGDSIQTAWKAYATGKKQGTVPLILKVSSSNVEENQVSRDIFIQSPPVLNHKVILPKELKVVEGYYFPESFKFKLLIINEGESSIENFRANLILPEGIIFTRREVPARVSSLIEGKGKEEFVWNIKADGKKSGNLKFSVFITSDDTPDKFIEETIYVPPINAKIEPRVFSKDIKVGNFFTIEIVLTGVKDFVEGSFNLKYNPASVKVIRTSTGEAFVKDGNFFQWEEPSIDNSIGMIEGFHGKLDSANSLTGKGSLALIHMRAEREGETEISLEEVMLKDKNNQQIIVEINSLKINILP